MKYRIKHIDTSLLWLTPFAFLNMGGSDYWEIQSKKHWWNKWKKVGYTYTDKVEAYREYFKLAYGLDIPERKLFKHNKNKNKKVWCDLKLGYLRNHSNNYNNGEHYYAGYKPYNYAHFYYCCYGKSYEEALNKLYWNLYVKEELLHKKM